MSVQCAYRKVIDGQTVTCLREALRDSDLCIIHSPANAKQPGTIQAAIRRELDNTELNALDFRGGKFPDLGDVFCKRSSIKPPVLFDGAEFNLPLNIEDTVFERSCSMRGIIQHKPLSFTRVQIGGDFVLAPAGDSVGSARLTRLTAKGRFEVHAAESNFQLRLSEESLLEGPAVLKGPFKVFVIENTAFKKSFQFENAKVQGPFLLHNVAFSGPTNLSLQEISQSPTFRNVQFQDVTRFEPAPLISREPMFQECDLTGVRFLTLPPTLWQGYDVAKRNIVDCTWPRRLRGIFRRHRLHVADEEDRSRIVAVVRVQAWIAKLLRRFRNHGENWGQSYIDVADHDYYFVLNLSKLYRVLHKKYYMDSEFTTASEFYISFMTMKRKANKGRFWARAVDLFYALFSRYGESIARPLIALSLIWTSATIFLMSLGIPLDSERPTVDISYSFGLSDGPFFLWLGDFWRAFAVNLASLSFFKAGAFVPKPFSDQSIVLIVEMILNVVFVGFLALAIRRQFAPKKPMD
jgi:hypothetical protein